MKKNKLQIYTAWINIPSERLKNAQIKFLKSCLYFQYVPVFYTDINIPENRPKFNELIRYGVETCQTDWLVWCNSDCEIVKDIREEFEDGMAIGFHRTEIPSEKHCNGIDMFAIHKDLWEDLLKDMPDMYVGGTHVDWWLARHFQNIEKLKLSCNCLYHESHGQTGAGDQYSGDEISKHNIDNFIAWAKRNGIDYETGWK